MQWVRSKASLANKEPQHHGLVVPKEQGQHGKRQLPVVRSCGSRRWKGSPCASPVKH